jgi:transposase
MSPKPDYQPGVFTVERHVRGKWVCNQCKTLAQASVPAHVIDKGIPTSGLLAQILVAKYADHLPLYRQVGIFERAGLALQFDRLLAIRLVVFVAAKRTLVSCRSNTAFTVKR